MVQREKGIYKDIIGDLPYELLAMVFKHLHISQLLEGRLVCRNWSSRLEYASSLGPWDLEVNSSFIFARAKEINAFRQGSPLQTWNARHNFADYCYEPTSMTAYQDHILAWVDPKDTRLIHLLYLDTDLRLRLRSASGKSVIHIHVSSSLIVAEDSSLIQIWDYTVSPLAPMIPFQPKIESKVESVANRTLLVQSRGVLSRYEVKSGVLQENAFLGDGIKHHSVKYIEPTDWLLSASGNEIYCLRSNVRPWVAENPPCRKI